MHDMKLNKNQTTKKKGHRHTIKDRRESHLQRSEAESGFTGAEKNPSMVIRDESTQRDQVSSHYRMQSISQE